MFAIPIRYYYSLSQTIWPLGTFWINSFQMSEKIKQSIQLDKNVSVLINYFLLYLIFIWILDKTHSRELEIGARLHQAYK